MRLRLFDSLLFLSLLSPALLFSQQDAPAGYERNELHPPLEEDVRALFGAEITTPPEFPVRTMAEWEEIQSICITWRSYPAVLKQIAAHAKQECEVIIIANNPNQVTNYLNSTNSGGPSFSDLENITIIQENTNSVWIRDYGQHTVYEDGVGQQVLVDWIYNRPRPADDVTPVSIAELKGLPLYSTIESPWDLMATGGNFMADGLGTAFSSELIVDENNGGFTQYYQMPEPDHSIDEVNDILEAFMGIDRYIHMETLPYDGIHHIDMHMKLLDEETLLIGEYPAGVADGPQIEANIEYIMSTYESPFGTPYKIERVQMPPENGQYPNTNGDYRTYANMVFINKTVLVPVYEAQYDVPALAVIQDLLPGYNVQGIDCNDIIQASGALHCITKAIGVDEPMHIVHQPLVDTEVDLEPYQVDAFIEHLSGIADATLFYRLDGGAFESMDMDQVDTENEDVWTGYIPAQPVGTIIDYYVEGVAVSGKTLTRPLPAPEGFWTFEILGGAVSLDELTDVSPLLAIYPNPANAITVIPIEMTSSGDVRLTLRNIVGQQVETVFEGELSRGEQKFFIDASRYEAGVYLVELEIQERRFTRKLVVR